MSMSEVFWVGFYSSMIALILGIGSQCYKSKCKEVSFCCIKIIRDTTAEEELDIQRPQNPISSQSLDRPNERL